MDFDFRASEFEALGLWDFGGKLHAVKQTTPTQPKLKIGILGGKTLGLKSAGDRGTNANATS